MSPFRDAALAPPKSDSFSYEISIRMIIIKRKNQTGPFAFFMQAKARERVLTREQQGLVAVSEARRLGRPCADWCDDSAISTVLSPQGGRPRPLGRVKCSATLAGLMNNYDDVTQGIEAEVRVARYCARAGPIDLPPRLRSAVTLCIRFLCPACQNDQRKVR